MNVLYSNMSVPHLRELRSIDDLPALKQVRAHISKLCCSLHSFVLWYCVLGALLVLSAAGSPQHCT